MTCLKFQKRTRVIHARAWDIVVQTGHCRLWRACCLPAKMQLKCAYPYLECVRCSMPYIDTGICVVMPSQAARPCTSPIRTRTHNLSFSLSFSFMSTTHHSTTHPPTHQRVPRWQGLVFCQVARHLRRTHFFVHLHGRYSLRRTWRCSQSAPQGLSIVFFPKTFSIGVCCGFTSFQHALYRSQRILVLCMTFLVQKKSYMGLVMMR